MMFEVDPGVRKELVGEKVQQSGEKVQQVEMKMSPAMCDRTIAQCFEETDYRLEAFS